MRMLAMRQRARTFRLAGLALGAQAAIFGALLAATPAAAQATTDLVFCNKTGAKAMIALVYMDAKSGQWTLTAWKAREPGQCGSVGAVKTGLFYFYAEKAGIDFQWPAKSQAEKTFCVPRAAVTRPTSSACGTDDRKLGFRGLTAEGAKYTINLQ